MEIYPIVQTKLLFFSALWGAVLALGWDVTAAIVEKIRPGALCRIIRFFVDLALMLIACIGIILLCYYFNFGEVRAFCVLGLSTAFFCCRAIFGRAVRALTGVILRAIRYVIRQVVLPIAKIYKFLVNILEKIIYYALRGIAKIALWVYNVYVKKSIVRKARKGFFGDV